MAPLVIAFFICFAMVMSYARHPGGNRRSYFDPGFGPGAAELRTPLPWRIVGAAFALRLFLGLALYYFRFNELLAPDVTTYGNGGVQVAQWWQTIKHVDVAPFIGDDQRRYMLVNAFVFYVLGDAPWVLLIATAFAGAWTVLLAWRVTLALTEDESTARTAAALVAFFPSLVLWSSVNLRDPFLVLAVMGVTWATVQLKEGLSVQAIFALIAWVALIGTFREYVVLLMVVGLVAGVTLGERHNLVWNVTLGASLLAGLAALLVSSDLGSEIAAQTSLDYVSRMRYGLTMQAESAFATGVNTSTLSGTLRFLPVGMLYFLYAPFPWAARGILQLLTVPEMLVWYALMWKIARGVRSSFAKNFSTAWVVTAFILVLVIGYGVLSGNAGTAYRHRAQVLPLFLVFAAAGLAKSRGPEKGNARIAESVPAGVK
jgi:hypothetical protein